MISLVLFMTLIFTIEGGKSNYIKLESKLSGTSPKSTSVQLYPPVALHLIFEISSSRRWFMNMVF